MGVNTLTVVNEKGARFFASWIPLSRVKSSLAVYERISAEEPVSDTELLRTNRRLAGIIWESLDDWRARTPDTSVDVDFDNSLEVDVAWVRQISSNLRHATDRRDMVTALDAFWSHFHEDLEVGRERGLESTNFGDILIRLRNLFGE
jgi:hypothetical protein